MRATDLARRVAMVAEALDQIGVTPGTISLYDYGQVVVHVEQQLGAVVDRLGLQVIREVTTDAGNTSTVCEGVWADIPVRAFGQITRVTEVAA